MSDCFVCGKEAWNHPVLTKIGHSDGSPSCSPVQEVDTLRKKNAALGAILRRVAIEFMGTDMAREVKALLAEMGFDTGMD